MISTKLVYQLNYIHAFGLIAKVYRSRIGDGGLVYYLSFYVGH